MSGSLNASAGGRRPGGATAAAADVSRVADGPELPVRPSRDGRRRPCEGVAPVCPLRSSSSRMGPIREPGSSAIARFERSRRQRQPRVSDAGWPAPSSGVSASGPSPRGRPWQRCVGVGWCGRPWSGPRPVSRAIEGAVLAAVHQSGVADRSPPRGRPARRRILLAGVGGTQVWARQTRARVRMSRMMSVLASA